MAAVDTAMTELAAEGQKTDLPDMEDELTKRIYDHLPAGLLTRRGAEVRDLIQEGIYS